MADINNLNEYLRKNDELLNIVNLLLEDIKKVATIELNDVSELVSYFDNHLDSFSFTETLKRNYATRYDYIRTNIVEIEKEIDEFKNLINEENTIINEILTKKRPSSKISLGDISVKKQDKWVKIKNLIGDKKLFSSKINSNVAKTDEILKFYKEAHQDISKSNLRNPNVKKHILDLLNLELKKLLNSNILDSKTFEKGYFVIKLVIPSLKDAILKLENIPNVNPTKLDQIYKFFISSFTLSDERLNILFKDSLRKTNLLPEKLLLFIINDFGDALRKSGSKDIVTPSNYQSWIIS
jgi:hypothetical protein